MARIGKFKAVVGKVCSAESRKILSANCSCEECDSKSCFAKRYLNIICSCEDCKNKRSCLGNTFKNTYTDEILAVYLKSSKPVTPDSELLTSLEDKYDYESDRQTILELNQPPPNTIDEYISKLLINVVPKHKYKATTLNEYIEMISGKANFKLDAYVKELKKNYKPLNAEHKIPQNVVDYSEVYQDGEIIHCKTKTIDSDSCNNYVTTENPNDYESDRKAIIKVNRPPPSSIDEYISNLLSDGEPLLKHKYKPSNLTEYIAIISQNSKTRVDKLNGYIKDIKENKSLNFIERKSADDFISSTDDDNNYEAYRECIFESNQNPPNTLEEYISTLIYDGEALPKCKTKPETLTEYIDIVSENANFKHKQESLNMYIQKIKGNKPLNPNETIALKPMKRFHTNKYNTSKINSSKSMVTSNLLKSTEYDCSKYESDRKQIIETNKTNLLYNNYNNEPVLRQMNKLKPSDYIDIVSEDAILKLKRQYVKDNQSLDSGEKIPTKTVKEIKIVKCSKTCKKCTKKADKDVTQIQRVMLTNCSPNYKSVPMPYAVPFRKFSDTICASCTTSNLSTFNPNKTGSYYLSKKEDTNSSRSIYRKIKEIYNACSCKVCECIATSTINNDVCNCKPCECADCTRYMNKFKIKLPFDLKLCQGPVMAKTCSCKPCQCIECNPLIKSKLNNIMETSVDATYQHETCKCSPRDCKYYDALNDSNLSPKDPINKKYSSYNFDVSANDNATHDALVSSKSTNGRHTEKIRQFDIRTASIIKDLYMDHNSTGNKQDNRHSLFSKLSYKNSTDTDLKFKGCSCEECECITCNSKDDKNRYSGSTDPPTGDELYNPDSPSYSKGMIKDHGLELYNLPKLPSSDQHGLSNNKNTNHSNNEKNVYIEKELNIPFIGHTIKSDAFVQCREFGAEKFLGESASANSHNETALNASNKFQQNYNETTSSESYIMNSLSNLNYSLQFPETVVETHLDDNVLESDWMQDIHSSISTSINENGNKHINKNKYATYFNSNRYSTQSMERKRKTVDSVKPIEDEIRIVHCYANAQGRYRNHCHLSQNKNPLSYSSQIIDELLDFCTEKSTYPISDRKCHSSYPLNLDITMELLNLNEDFNRVKKVLQDAQEYSEYLLQVLETYEKANQEFEKISDALKTSQAVFDLEVNKNKEKVSATSSNNMYFRTLVMSLVEQSSNNIHEFNEIAQEPIVLQNLEYTNLSKGILNEILSSALDTITTTANVNVEIQKSEINKHNSFEFNSEQVLNDNDSHNKNSQILLTEHVIDLVTDGTKHNKEIKLTYNKKEKLRSKYCKKHCKPIKNNIIITKEVCSKKSSQDCLSTKLSSNKVPLITPKNCSSKSNKEVTVANTKKLNEVMKKLDSVFSNSEHLCHIGTSVGTLENANNVVANEGSKLNLMMKDDYSLTSDPSKLNKFSLLNLKKELVERTSTQTVSSVQLKKDVLNCSQNEIGLGEKKLNLKDNDSLSSEPSMLRKLSALNLEMEHTIQKTYLQTASIIENRNEISQNQNKEMDENKSIELPKKSIPVLKDLLQLENSAQTVSCNENRIDNKVKFLLVRKVSEHSVLIKWSQPRDLANVKGYELLVDGRAVQHVFNPSKCLAVVTCLPNSHKILLTIRTISCVDSKSEQYPSSTIVYRPRVK